MTLPREIRESAFAMYCADIPPMAIAETIGLKTRSTIHRWVNKYGWAKRRAEVRKIAFEKSTLATTKRNRQLLAFFINLAGKRLQDYSEKELNSLADRMLKNPKEIADLMKAEKLEQGLPTEILSSPSEKTLQELDDIYERARREIEAEEKAASDSEKKKRG